MSRGKYCTELQTILEHRTMTSKKKKKKKKKEEEKNDDVTLHKGFLNMELIVIII